MFVKGAAQWLGTGILLGMLAVAGCGDPDPVSSYCSAYNYCFGDDLADCLEERDTLEEQALAVGAQCHEAYVEFNRCIAELSCADLNEYLADQSHCGARYNAWQNRCSPP